MFLSTTWTTLHLSLVSYVIPVYCSTFSHANVTKFNDFIPCSVTLQEIVDTELLDKKYNEDEARVSANHFQST